MDSLRSYDDWKHCITVACGIALTPAFIARRLSELKDGTNGQTQRFVETWGAAHLARVIGWFEEAQQRAEGR